VSGSSFKRKRFQVTQAAIRSPAGMRGQSIACNVVEAYILLLPVTVFLGDRLRLSAPEFARLTTC
jgi:hypothetical protein